MSRALLLSERNQWGLVWGDPASCLARRCFEGIILRTSVCGTGQLLCVCAGVGLCGCYSQHTKGEREVRSKPGSCARRGGPISHTVSLVPGPSMGALSKCCAHPTPQDPPLPLSAWQMEIFWIERNRNIRDKNQLIKIWG